MSRLDRNYEKLKKIELDFVEADSKVHNIAQYLNRLEMYFYEALSTSSYVCIEEKTRDYYEAQVRVDCFLSDADDNICEELRALQNDIKNEEEEKRKKIESVFGGFF